MLAIIQREYGIDRNTALWNYSYDEIQDLISQIPQERLIKTYGKESQADLDRRWLELFADFDSSVIVKERDAHELRVKKLNLKQDIKKETDPAKKKLLQEQLKKIGG